MLQNAEKELRRLLKSNTHQSPHVHQAASLIVEEKKPTKTIPTLAETMIKYIDLGYLPKR